MTFAPLPTQPSGPLARPLREEQALGRLLRRPLALFGVIRDRARHGRCNPARPFVAPYDPTEQYFDGLSLEGSPLPPSAQYWLGTDLLGRDLLSRLIFGARTSLVIGVVANGIAVAIGGFSGLPQAFSAAGSDRC